MIIKYSHPFIYKQSERMGYINMEKPNIIFILSDQQRWDTVGCYGQTLPLTPVLDKIAESGVCFEYAFTCQPVCGPARSCLQTGKYATRTGCHINGIALPENEKTIAHYLKDAGYSTGYIGKWHLASNGYDEDYSVSPVPAARRGGYDFWLASDILEATSHSYDGFMFDGEGNKRFFPEGRYRVDAQTDWVLEYLDNQNQGIPFFLMVSFLEPHHQNDHGRFEGPAGSKEKYKDAAIPEDLTEFPGDWNSQYPDYLGCCASLDENLGRIMSRLDDLKLSDNTIVIYSSDHGCHFKTRNSEYKRSCHESSIRIPLIISGGDFKGGIRKSNLTGLIDIPETILKCAGLDIPEYMDGKPLQTLLESDDPDWSDEIFVQISESQVGRCIRTSRYKYSIYDFSQPAWTTNSSSDCYTENYLYDLENDPHEKNNLIINPEYAEVRKTLAALLIKKMLQAEEKIPVILPAT